MLVTVVAAGLELLGAMGGRSLFLVADVAHLFAHVGIFAVLLIPAGVRHARAEDASAIAVLALVATIALSIVAFAGHAVATGRAAPEPALMALSIAGLIANAVAAWLLVNPAREWWSFRAALAHELSDGALTIAGLVGAVVIALLGWDWVDPLLSLAIGTGLGWWSLRLLAMRVRHGPEVWTMERGRLG